MATALFSEHFQVGNSSGQPVAGALLYFYSPGTTTPITTYADSGLITPSTTVMQTDGSSAIVADNTGTFAPIYVTTSPFKFVLKTAGLITIQTVDPAYVSVSSGSTSPVLFADGTVSLPGLAFTADPNTGIYRIGADDAGLSAGGTLALEWTSSAVKVKASFLNVLDASDTSKIAKFDASAITTATTRTYAVPDASGTIALSNTSTTLLGTIGFERFFGFRNRLINGTGVINQRVYTTAADDVYWCDRHYVLTQTAAITPVIQTNIGTVYPTIMRLTQTQSSAQRMGNAQIIETLNCQDLHAKTVTLLGKLRCSSAQAIRYAVLEWTGTADTVTSDVVNNWTSGSFSAGNFFNSTTLNVLAVGSVTPVANTFTDFLITAVVGLGATNLITFIWTEGTAAQNVTLDHVWELLPGDFTGQVYPLSMRSVGEEQALCDRYFQSFGGDRGFDQFAFGLAKSTTQVNCWGSLRGKMRIAAPAVGISTAGDFALYDAATTTTVTALADVQTNSTWSSLVATVSSGLTQNRPYSLAANNSNSARLTFSAEL